VKKVKLEDVLEAIEPASEDGNYYYNKITGKIINISHDKSTIAEDCSDEDLVAYPEWEREAIEAAIDVEENFENYITLPSRFDINEYNIMVDFCNSLDNDKISSQLLNALNGRGAFRRFKDTSIRLDLQDEWYEFQDKAFKKIALDWCNENGIEVEKTR
jgi:hypothetical protein